LPTTEERERVAVVTGAGTPPFDPDDLDPDDPAAGVTAPRDAWEGGERAGARNVRGRVDASADGHTPQEFALVDAARRGEEWAVEALYRTHYDTIYKYVLYRLGSLNAAEDVVSKVFLGMVSSLPRFEWQGRPFVAWLYAIAQKQVAHHFRSEAKSPLAVELEAAENMVADTLGPDASVEDRERRVRLSQALRMLPDSQREVVLLRLVMQLSLAETAASTGRSEGAIKQLQLRGLATLKDVLGRP
jgi:RNA polymerase sigma-70 factor (ECF subfamily)